MVIRSCSNARPMSRDLSCISSQAVTPFIGSILESTEFNPYSLQLMILIHIYFWKSINLQEGLSIENCQFRSISCVHCCRNWTHAHVGFMMIHDDSRHYHNTLSIIITYHHEKKTWNILVAYRSNIQLFQFHIAVRGPSRRHLAAFLGPQRGRPAAVGGKGAKLRMGGGDVMPFLLLIVIVVFACFCLMISYG